MNNNGGAISFDALINNSQFLKSFQEMEERIKRFTTSAGEEASKTDMLFSKLGDAIDNAFNSDNLKEVALEIIKVRGEFQALEGTFKIMLGSKQKADELMTKVADLATKTPLSLTQVGESAKMLLSYGFSVDSVMQHLQMLGDVSRGVNIPIEDLVNTFGAIRTNGVASLSDIQGMAGKGIPIFEELRKVLNTNRDGVEKMVEASKVGLPQIELAFQSMTSTGGMFSGVMKEQAKSVDALMTNLEESINRVYNEIGKDTDGLVAGTLQMGVSMLENYKSIAKILEVLAITYGASKASLIIYNVVVGIQTQLQLEAALAGRALSVSEGLAAVGAKGLSMATAELNAVMAVNPYVLMATGIVAVVSAMVLTRKETIELKNANELLAESIKEVRDNHIGEKEEVLANIQVLKNKNVADSVREQAYKRINELSPKLLEGMSLEEAKIKDLTLVTRNYIAELEQKIQLEGNSSALKKGIKQRNDLQEVYDNIDKAYQEKLKRVNQLKKSGTQADKLKLYGDGQDNLGLMYDLEQLKKELDAAKIQLQESKDEIEKLNKNRVNIYANDPAVNALKATIEGEKIRLKGIKNNLSPEYKQLEDSIKKHQKELDSLQNTNKPSNTVVKNKSYWDEELKRRQEDFYKVEKGAKNYEKLKAAVKEAQNELKNYNVNQGSNNTNNVPQVDEKLKGTIAYYDQIIARSKYLQERTTNQSSLTTLIVEQGEAMRKKAELQEANDKQLENELSKSKIKTFEEEIEEKKKQYVLYENWVKNIGKKVADDHPQFKDLLPQGNNYVDFLSKKIKEFETKQNDVNLDPTAKTEAQDNLVKYKVEYQIVTGKKSGVELLKEDMLKAKKEAKSLVEYLEYIEKLKEKLKSNTSTDQAEANAVVEEANQTKEQIAENLKEYLSNHETYEEQKDNIIKKHIGLREALESQYTDKTNAEYLKNLEKLKKGKEEELDIIKKTNEEKIAYLKSLQDSLRIIDLKYLKEKVETERKTLNTINKETNFDDYIQQLKKVQDAEKNLNDHLLSVVSKFASLGGQLGGVLSQMNGAIGDTGQLLSGLAQNADNLVNAFKKGATSTDKWMTGITATIGLIDLVASSASEREKAEEEYRKNALQFEQDYKVAINERIGAEAKTKENVFVKDYAVRLKDGFKMYNDASAKYQESLKKLEQGKAKVGQRNAVDWGKVGGGAAMGAALGTAIVPIIGTAIGAVVGGIIGLFGGKKKKDVFTGLLQEYPELIQKATNGQEIFNKELAETLISNNQVDDATKQMLQDSITWSDQMEKTKGQIKEIISDLAGDLGGKLRDGLLNAFKDGTSAAEAFGKSVTEILESMLNQLVFNQIFKQAFDDLEKDMTNSFDPDNGDQNVLDDMQKFMAQAPSLTKMYEEALTALNAAGKGYGLDIFGKNKPASANSLTGSVKSITEDTAGLLAGNITQLRVVATSQLVSLRNVEMIASQQLTLQAKFLPFLERIDNNLNKLNSGDNILRVKF